MGNHSMVDRDNDYSTKEAQRRFEAALRGDAVSKFIAHVSDHIERFA
jgi:hypothetical protein